MPNTYIFDRGDFDEEDEDNEGMLNFKVYDLKRFEERCRQSVEQIDTRYKEEHRKVMEEQVAMFRKYTQDETYHQKVMKELERRKIANQAILRGYGLEF